MGAQNQPEAKGPGPVGGRGPAHGFPQNGRITEKNKTGEGVAGGNQMRAGRTLTTHPMGVKGGAVWPSSPRGRVQGSVTADRTRLDLVGEGRQRGGRWDGVRPDGKNPPGSARETVGVAHLTCQASRGDNGPHREVRGRQTQRGPGRKNN